jgi:two-component system sensor histidine kinase DctS
VATSMARMIDAEAGKNQVRIKLELAPTLARAHADRIMIEQVILNLVKNAMEALRNTSPEEREIVLRTSPDITGTVHIEVIDNGRGLPDAMRENLYTAFFTTKPDGMGMGLHICRSIVEVHGGGLWATSNPGKGSVFHFTLPIAKS